MGSLHMGIAAFELDIMNFYNTIFLGGNVSEVGL